MNTTEKKEKIKSLVLEMLEISNQKMINNIEKVFNSGSIDVDEWDETNGRMVLPKCIVRALLENATYEYEGRGTGMEKKLKKEVENIKYFLS
jgi:hypothetical protein